MNAHLIVDTLQFGMATNYFPNIFQNLQQCSELYHKLMQLWSKQFLSNYRLLICSFVTNDKYIGGIHLEALEFQCFDCKDALAVRGITFLFNRSFGQHSALLVIFCIWAHLSKIIQFLQFSFVFNQGGIQPWRAPDKEARPNPFMLVCMS